MVASGPLETLIALFGADFIDQIEERACQSPRFRYVLTGVWAQGQNNSDVWKRIEIAREPMIATGIDSDAAIPPADARWPAGSDPQHFADRKIKGWIARSPPDMY